MWGEVRLQILTPVLYNRLLHRSSNCCISLLLCLLQGFHCRIAVRLGRVPLGGNQTLPKHTAKSWH